MRKFQSLLGTALAYSVARYWMDKNPGMHQVWGWYATAASAGLLFTGLVSYWTNARSRQKENGAIAARQSGSLPIVAPSETAVALPQPIKINGWLRWFIIRFFIGAAIALFTAIVSVGGKDFLPFLVIGSVELTIGFLLARGARVGLILVRIWLVLEAVWFGLLSLVAVAAHDPEFPRMTAYCLGSLLLVFYAFLSKRVKATYPKARSIHGE
jgi:hypothetical protein